MVFTRCLSFLGALLLLSAVFFGAFALLDYHWSWNPVAQYWRLFLKGWLATVSIAGIALPLSLVLGLALALLQRSPWRLLRDACRIWVELTRCTPLLLQIYVYFYVFGQALALDNRYVVGPLILCAFSAAYMSETLRAGIESVGKSQWESARAIGLTPAQTYRWVVFPQAIRQILPSLAGQFVSLIKDSSLLSVIGLSELTLAAQEVNAFTYAAFESYLPVAAGYLVLTLPLSLWTRSLERRLRFET
jgi:polar amino acid transport system permease protein